MKQNKTNKQTNKRTRGLVFFQNTIPHQDQFIDLKVPNYVFLAKNN